MKETGHGENWDRRGNDTKLKGFWASLEPSLDIVYSHDSSLLYNEFI